MMSSVLDYCSKELSKEDNKKTLREKIVKPVIEIILSELKHAATKEECSECQKKASKIRLVPY